MGGKHHVYQEVSAGTPEIKFNSGIPLFVCANRKKSYTYSIFGTIILAYKCGNTYIKINVNNRLFAWGMRITIAVKLHKSLLVGRR